MLLDGGAGTGASLRVSGGASIAAAYGSTPMVKRAVGVDDATASARSGWTHATPRRDELGLTGLEITPTAPLSRSGQGG